MARRGTRVEIGGVCKHVACVLGSLSAMPRFVTTHYPGELGGLVADSLVTNHVDWQPVPITAPFALFQADLDPADHVWAESFTAGESIDALTPELLIACPALTGADAADVIVTCTNLSVPAIDALAGIVHQRGSLWLLLSSDLEADRIAQIDSKLRAAIGLLSLNLSELRLATGAPHLTDLTEIAEAGRSLVTPGNHCLITLGSRGSLLCTPGTDHALYQPVAPIRGQSPVGGGDVLFASLLAGHLRGYDWPDALRFANVCTRRYLMRDSADPHPYRVLIDPVTPSELSDLPPLERISL